MERQYLISEQELRNFIYAVSKLEALENGGVDSWEFYNDSIEDYLDDVNNEYEGENFEYIDDYVDFFLHRYYENEVE